MIRRKMLIAALLVSAIAASGLPAGPAAGDTEPNDSFPTAEWVTPGAWNNGATNLSDMKDSYKFNLSTGQVCNINCMVGMSSPRFYFSVYNQSEMLLKRSGLVEPYSSWYLNYTLGQSGAGMFYIVAEAESCATNPYGSYGFQLTIHNQSDAGKAQDAGDTADAARQIGEGSCDGWLADLDGADWYKFSVPGGFRINASLNPGPEGSSPLMMSLHRAGTLSIKGTGWLQPGSSGSILHTTSELTGDTYFLSICQTAGGGNNYTLSLSVRPQNDAGAGRDAPGSLLRGLALPGSGGFSGWLADDDILDGYNISLAGGQTIGCILEAGRSSTDSLNLTLSRPGGDNIFITTVRPGTSGTRDWILNSTGGGIYHVGVANRNSYNLTVSIKDQEDAGWQGDAGETSLSARPVVANYDYKGLLGGDDGCDFYSFPGKMTQPLTVNFLTTNTTAQGRLALYDPSGTSLLDLQGISIGVPVSNRASLTRTGDYSLMVSGGRMDYAFNLTIPLDNIPPSLNITSPGEDEGSITPDITVSGTASDNIGVVLVQISRDNSTWLNCTGMSAWTGNLKLSEGANTIYARVKDVAGNTARSSRPVYYDKTPPVLNVSWPADLTFQRVTWVDVRGNASDNCRICAVEVCLEGTNWKAANGTSAWSITNFTLAEGPNVLQIRVRDMAGNSDNWKIRLTVDIRPPQISVSSPVNGSFLGCSTVELAGAASDNFGLDRVDASLPGGAWRTATIIQVGNWMLTGFPLDRGANNITVRATDRAGNTASRTISVTVDTEPPMIAISSPANGKKVNMARLSVKGTASDNILVTGLSLKVNGEDVLVSGNSSWTADVTLKEGKNGITVTAMDKAGLTTSTSITVTYEKPKPQPGFEGLLIPAALGATILALMIKRK